MKKLLLSLVCLLLTTPAFLNAQSASDFYKKAKKSFDKYQQSDESEKLEEALNNIKQSVELISEEDDKTATKIWIKAGEIYNQIAMGDYEIFLVNNNHKPVHPLASEKAWKAYFNAVNTADKKWDKSKSLDELLKTATFISNEGIVAYNIELYEESYHSFKRILDIKKFLGEQDHVSILNNPTEYNQHVFRTGLAAEKAGYDKEAEEHFEFLVDAKFNNPTIYSSLFKIYSEDGKEAKALTRIKSGRELFPEDEGLMIAEINHYLDKGQMEQLTNKLEQAIEKNPSNVSLYSTMGHVYNELQKVEVEKGNITLSKTYFQQSMDYFSRALDINGTYAPALYNLGALYYNKAAIITKEIKSTEEDKSAIGIRQTNAKKSEMVTILDQALPFFQRAEAINPNDVATLGALKEIYTRKNDESLVGEFTSRLEKIQKGEEIKRGYFDQ